MASSCCKMALLCWLRCQCSSICKTVAQKICVVVLWKWMWCATRKVSLRVEQEMCSGGCCGGVLVRHWLGEGGDLLVLRAEHPLLWGIWPPAFPTPLPRGPLQQLEKAHRAPSGALCFFLYTVHPLCKQACNGLSGYKKSPQALLESFFPLLR